MNEMEFVKRSHAVYESGGSRSGGIANGDALPLAQAVIDLPEEERRVVEMAVKEDAWLEAIGRVLPEAIVKIGRDGTIRGFHAQAEQLLPPSTTKSAGDHGWCPVCAPHGEEEYFVHAQENLQQQLAGLGLLAEHLAEDLSRRLDGSAHTARRLASGIYDLTQSVDELSRWLLPATMDGHELVDALRHAVRLANSHSGVHCSLQCKLNEDLQDGNLAAHLYRIATEALTNALQHSEASQIKLLLEESEESVRLVVSDNGHGFDYSRDHGGTGLRIIAYRASCAGGTMSVEPLEPSGTAISCCLPWGATNGS